MFEVLEEKTFKLEFFSTKNVFLPNHGKIKGFQTQKGKRVHY